MGAGAKMFITSLIKTGSGIQNLMQGKYTDSMVIG
jgi:hypothetical protein